MTTFVVGNKGPVMATALRDKTIDAFAGGSSDRAGIEAQGVMFRNITPAEISRNPGNSLSSGARPWKRSAIIPAFLAAGRRRSMPASLDTKLSASVCRTLIPEQFENLEVGTKMINGAVYHVQLRRTLFDGDLQPDVWASIQPAYLKAG